jgi:predicted flap endonuclease-1-like 5' DNA nuclease
MPDTQHTEQDSDFPRGIGNPARQALHVAGYHRLDQLTGLTEAELLRMHGVGPKASRVLREALAAQGLSFAGEDQATTHP